MAVITPYVRGDDTNIILGFFTIVAVLPLTLRFYNCYLAYLALGPGGTPATVPGFVKVSLLGLFAIQNPYKSTSLHHTGGHLKHLPQRQGRRPQVKGIAPHRQVTQKAEKHIFERLSSNIIRMASDSRDELRVGTSCIEQHGIGLFTTMPGRYSRHRCRTEVCHAHPSDGSMHMTLHPADAKVVLEAGWGEKHPLSRGGYFERFVPEGFVMVYSPRDEADVDIAIRIIEAAAWYVSGECYNNTQSG
ncbi:hypothetical protein LTR37_003797 [Vermiconidia calcicola]|uniref:Uncharacterized protein n=1 Tax=Vermiconidia calcicola TaxID=1690605 RepID=A0ACC3NNR1_9PEZI|nr:hypothetical protein LTR37_003797 [Vermiconidia calcicola]